MSRPDALNPRDSDFRNLFPKELSELLKAAKSSIRNVSSASEQRLISLLSPVIFRHRRLHVEKTIQAFEKAIESFSAASKLINRASRLVSHATPALSLLDTKQFKAVKLMLDAGKVEEVQIGTLPLRLDSTANEANIWAMGLELAVSTKSISRRGRPTSEKNRATAELMLVWKEFTGKEPVSPNTKLTSKGSRTTEIQEPSTRFIEIGLKMIFEKVSTSQVQSSIRHVLASRRKLKTAGLWDQEA